MYNSKGQSIKERLSLPFCRLKRNIDYSQFDFETTEEIPRLTGIIGQKRGREAMRFGLHVNKIGYNIYVAGIGGTGKTNYTKSIVQEFAKKDKKLYDWCYVYNFENKYNPKMLKLPTGMGKKLQQDMKKFIEKLKIDIPKAFSEESYQKERASIVREFQEKSNKVVQKLDILAYDYGFTIRQSGSNFITVPIINGEEISDKEYKNLNPEKINEIEKNSSLLQEKVVELTHEIQKLEKEAKNNLENLDNKIALAAVGYHMDELKKRYEKCYDVIKYFQKVQEDILKNIEDFQEQKQDKDGLGIFSIQDVNDFTRKYNINLLVDNSETKGAPIVIADNPHLYNLVGKVEYENKMGVLSTDFTKIKSGYLHQANGGYIIMQAIDILRNNYTWEALKRGLKNQKLNIENIGEQLGMVATTSIKPQSIPLDIKVILIGSPNIYQLLYHYDEDFKKLFKIKADFDTEMDNNKDNLEGLAQFIRTHCEEADLRNFDKTAVAKVGEYSIRMAGHQGKLSARFNPIVELLYEADTWAELMEDTIITAKHVEKAIDEKIYRSNLYEEKIQESIEEGNILIDTQGKKIGQVNGLAVYQLGQYSFGKPARITATTYSGQGGIVNIERESKMSGKIHNKGVYILSGYLGENFAQEHPLSLSANLAFEQSYGGVDGDSASSTELYALLSSLSEVPIDQGLAVTGSVNQKGEIQPIGGVNEKIEGFFDICKIKGLTGSQGVLIPHQNVKNLMLKDEIVKAVKEGNFHIYQVRNVEEGIEILTGVDVNSVFNKVRKKLKKYIDQSGKEDKKVKS